MVWCCTPLATSAGAVEVLPHGHNSRGFILALHSTIIQEAILNKILKSKLAIIVVSCMAASLVLAGCGGNAAEDTTAANAGGATADHGKPAGQR